MAPAQDKETRSARTRMAISGVILAIFWGALLYDYWPALVPAVLHLFNSARSVGADMMESRHFTVRNNSMASADQLQALLATLEQEYDAISAYTETTPAGKLDLLVVDGPGPAMIDGKQIVVSYDDGEMDIELAPLYLAILVQDIPVDPTGGLVPGGGQALHVVEGAGLGSGLIRQPLDAWTLLLLQNNAYLPLEEAWGVTMPNSDDGYYDLLRGMLENGSFMGWFASQYGLEASQRVARGETMETVSGKPLGENEAAWLRWLDQQTIQPKPCDTVIPKNSLFRLLCNKLMDTDHKP